MSPVDLGRLPLLHGLPAAELEQVDRLLTPFQAPAGLRLFEQGEPGDRLCLIGRGRLRASIALPDGDTQVLAEMDAGAAIGEIALFTGGRRSASVTALTDTEGWLLDRRGFEALLLDTRPGSLALLNRLGELVVTRLRRRYEAIAAQCGPLPDGPVMPASGALPHLGPPPLEHMGSLLCFSRFERADEVAAVVRDAQQLTLARGDVLLSDGERPPALWLVVHGAIELAARRAGAVHRLRLAGPGRFVGHLGVLDTGPSPAVARARERSVLLALPRARVEALIADPRPAGRRFAAAVFEDVARAVREAERPMTSAIASRPRAAEIAA